MKTKKDKVKKIKGKKKIVFKVFNKEAVKTLSE